MSVPSRQQAEWKLLETAIARLRASIMAVVFGFFGGTALFAATALLLIRDVKPVGPHLALLSNYFPGYTMTWTGSLIGFLYGAGLGAAIGWSVAWLYNRIVNLRHPP